MARLLTRPTLAAISPSRLSLPRQTLRPGTRLIPCKAAAPRLTLVSRLTFHGSWERSENEAGGLFQHPARQTGWDGLPSRHETASHDRVRDCASPRGT